MKIIHPHPAAILEATPVALVTRAPADGAPKGAPGQTDAGGAKVELSSTAASLRANTVPAEFDAAKVERIAQAIADGRFHANAEAIADKLIANAQELLGKVRR